MYSGIKFTNNASTQLTQTLLATDTVLYVGTNSASIFPKLDTTDDYFLLTLFDVNKNREVVKCTARTDDSCTIVRAQEGTTARTFQAGTLVELRLTANSITKVAEDASSTKPHASTDHAAYGQATAQVYSHAKLTDNFELGTQAINGVICTPYALQQAVSRILNVATTTLLTESGTWVVPETGVYTVTCVGAGGNGGNGGNGAVGVWLTSESGEVPQYGNGAYSGGAGGGGGAGQVTTTNISLTRGQSIAVTIGASPSGSTTFGTYITSLGGSSGTSGTSAVYPHDFTAGSAGYAGSAGFSYGSVATSGQNGTAVEVTSGGGGANNISTADAIGGSAGVSINGTFGNGGRGGNGGGASFPPEGARAGATGARGVQGCVLITMVLR